MSSMRWQHLNGDINSVWSDQTRYVNEQKEFQEERRARLHVLGRHVLRTVKEHKGDQRRSHRK